MSDPHCGEAIEMWPQREAGKLPQGNDTPRVWEEFTGGQVGRVSQTGGHKSCAEECDAAENEGNHVSET